MKPRRKHLFFVCIFGLVLALSSWNPCAAKEEYPIKPIQLIVAWPVGGDTDLVARVWAEYAKSLLGQPIVVINKPGVAGVLGSTFFSKTKPDGYTLMQSPPGNVLLAPQLTKVEYKTEDFIPICRITATPCAIVVHADSPWKKMEDFVQDAKKNPNKFSFGSLGMSSWTNLAFKFWEMQAGIKLKDIFQQGSAPATMALLGRHVDISFLYPQVFIPHVKDGKFRVLAIGDPWDEYPQIPTFKSLGYKGNYNGWSGIFAPKGTPSEIIQKIAETSQKIMSDSKFLEALKNVNSTPGFMGPEQWQKQLKQEHDDLSKVVDELGIRVK